MLVLLLVPATLAAVPAYAAALPGALAAAPLAVCCTLVLGGAAAPLIALQAAVSRGHTLA